jgi:predicted TIM-barrel fold metal-dependent hydrolase
MPVFGGGVYRFFSVDDHIIEPANVWTSRLPARYRDVGPHVEEDGDRQWWAFEDQRITTMGTNAVVGKPREEWDVEPIRFSDMRPACYDPELRAKDLRSQGIFASVNFPTLPRFGGALFPFFKDKTLADLCVRAWNDFVLDEWCGADPDIFVPMVICQLWDPALAHAEIERCLDKGAKALCFVENTVPLGLPSLHDPTHWDPVFGICEEAGLPVCMHIGSSGTTSVPDPRTPMIVTFASVAFAGAALASINMMMSPVPRKWPNIKLVWSEGGIGWVPSAMERADRQYERHLWSHASDDLMPSEVCRRNMWFCMIEEPVGLRYRHDFRVDHILWESDYPHADTPYPNTQENARVVFTDVPDDEVELITHRNAEVLFNHRLVVTPEYLHEVG